MAANNDVLAAVREFFDSAGYAGLILPNGWFGRPYDNLHQLTRSEASNRALLLELDGQFVLVFSGELWVTSTEGGLQLGGYTVLTWDWVEFGSTVSRREEFSSGEVELVAPVG